MDERYRAVADHVMDQFVPHLGSRLKSVFVKGSIARGDALWGVSDIDIVLAFDTPTEADAALKREVEAKAMELPAGDKLVIQRIWEDRLEEMTPGVKAFWLRSCRYDAETLYGAEPGTFLPAPVEADAWVSLVAPIIHADGELVLECQTFSREETRLLAKRILHALSLPFIASGDIPYLVHREIVDLPLSPEVRKILPAVVFAYKYAPIIEHPQPLRDAWQVAWDDFESRLNVRVRTRHKRKEENASGYDSG